MLRVFGGVIVVGVVVFALSFIFSADDEGGNQRSHGLPWQIDTQDAEPKVFFLTLGKSSLQQAVDLYGPDYELAIMSKDNQVPALELYFPYFKSGPLRGKLIAGAELDAEDLNQLNSAAGKLQYLETGTKKRHLNPSQTSQALSFLIKHLTFIPVARLDIALLEQYFGVADSVLSSTEHVKHYFYPNTGVVITIDEKGKDFIFYLSDKAFAAFQKNLQQQKLDKKSAKPS